MSRWIEFFLKNTKLVNITSIVICVVGGFVLWEMKRDLHPPFQFEEIEIEARLSGASPQEMESLVTFPIEENLKGQAGVKKIRSFTSDSATSINITFESGYSKMSQALEDIRQRISKMTHRLPKDLQPVQIRQQSETEIFLASFVFKNVDPLNPKHRESLLRFRSEIENIEGISSVNLEMDGRDVYVRFNPKNIERYGVSTTQIRTALSEYFSFVPLGRLRKNENEWAVELKQPFLDIDKLNRLPLVVNRLGRSITLSDVAAVEWGSGERHTRWLIDGTEGTWLDIRKDPASDALRLHDVLQSKIAELKPKLAAPIEIKELMNGPYFIRQQLDVLKFNGIQGLILVLLLLTLFLHWRLALMAAFGIPIAYLGSFIVLRCFGVSLDLLSLIGLIIVSGVLVDDAIIISEMYCQNLEKGMKPKEAALQAVRSMMVPVTGTIMTTILAFIPILIIRGSLTWFLAAIPVVVGSTLVLSWFESFFLLPNHLTHFVSETPKDFARRFFEIMRAVYARYLSLVVRFRYVASLCVIAAFAASLWIAKNKLEHYFNLGIGSEQVKIYATFKKSESLDDTQKRLGPLLKVLETYPNQEVEYYWASVGRQWRDGRRFVGYRFAEITLTLDRFATHPSILKNRILERLKGDLARIDSTEFEELATQARTRGQENFKKDMISVKLVGSDTVNFLSLEKEIIRSIEKVPPLEEAVTDLYQYQEGWQFDPDGLELNRYRLSRLDLGTQIRQFFSPHLVGETRHGGETVQVLTEYRRSGNTPSINDLGNFKVTTPMGTVVPLSYFGTWSLVKNLRSLEHVDGARNLTIDFRFDEKQVNAEGAKAAIEQRLEGFRKRNSGVTVTVGDANEYESENKVWIFKVFGVCIALILGVLVFVLGSFTQPVIVALPIPLGIMGAIWALYAHGQPLTLMAMVGLLGVVGIAVNDSIVMVHQINQSKDKSGRLSRGAIIGGAVNRLRAIFLTATTTIAGVVPVAYGLGGESGFTQPIAFTMGYGLAVSSTMTLFLLPAFLVMREDVLDFWRIVLNLRRGKITSGSRSDAELGLSLADFIRSKRESQETESRSNLRRDDLNQC